MSFRPLTASYAEVANLPANITPVSNPSKPIERLLTKRAKGHNSTINSVKLNCQKYSTEIEEEIRKESVRFNTNFNKIKNELENELKIFSVPEDELVNLNLELFEKVSTDVQDRNRQRLKIVDDFYEILKNLERKRSKYFKSVLNDGYRKTSKISHLLPYELLNFFETEIVKLNEITMSNYYHYAKLHSDFKLQSQEDLRIVLLRINEIKDKYKMAVKMAKVKGVIDAHKRERETFDTLAKVDYLQNINSEFSGNVPRTPSCLRVWTQEMKMTLDNLDANAKKLLSLYKMAVVHIFNRFFVELKTITDALVEDEGKGKSLDKIDMGSDLYESIIKDVTEIYRCDVAYLKDLWNSVTEYMESNIKNTQLFLNGSAHLWDEHFKRYSNSRKLMIKEIELVIDKHDKAAERFDKKINISLDKLRQGSTLDKLDQHLKDVYKFLDSIKRLYQTQCEEEIDVLKKYHILIDRGIELLISEIDRFLSQHADGENIQQRKSEPIRPVEDHENVEEVEDPNDRLIPLEMKICQYQVNAVNNWMFGLWEAIKCYMLTCRKELSEEANQWMNNTTTKLKKRLEVRLATLKPRYQRVKAMVYDVRLKELEDHANDYKKIEEAVDRHMKESRNFNKNSQADRMEIFDKFENVLHEIEEKLQNATRSQHVASSIDIYKAKSSEVNEALVRNFEENFKFLKDNLDNINKTIFGFAQNIKLFPNGGNYSRDEVKIYKSKIIKLKKSVPKKYKKIWDEYNQLKPQTMVHFNQTTASILSRMILSKEEFEHNEKICIKINGLRNAIRTSAYDIKFRIHRLRADIDYYQEISKIDIWKRKHFDMIKDAVDDCIKKINSLTTVLISDTNKIDNSNLYQLYQLIDNSYEEIGDISKNFYGNHTTIINKGKVQKNYDDFMEEVKRNYDGFKVQVEVHCLECVENLIKDILRLLKVNDEICEDLVRKFGRRDSVVEEEKEELRLKLSQEAVDIEETRKLLEERKYPVEEIILKNKNSVSVLQSSIVKLMDHIINKVIKIKEIIKEDEESEI